MSLIAESPRLRGTRPAVLHEFFDHSRRRTPHAVAVDVPPGTGRPERVTLTYAELDRESAALAGTVRAASGRTRVSAVLLPRGTAWLYVAQLAVLRSGAAYVCLDPGFPDEQVAHILADSTAGVLLTDAAGQRRARAIGFRGPVVRVDRPPADAPPPRDPGDRPPARPGPDDIAYLIYTSGSTGPPKGVLIGHRGIVGLIGGDLAEFRPGPGDRVAQGSSPAYDSSVEEVWLALAAGATVVVLDDETARLGPDLVGWLREERITVLCPPPTLLRATGCREPWRELPELRLLYVGGEALPEDVAARWSRGRRMVNGYGPTECTVTCLRAEVVAGQRVAIGRPVPGMRAWVLDENLRPVPPGARGELCMGGPGVAAGYLHRPELTAEKFPTLPGAGRIYRTGDLVHVEPDGTFYYHGRIDSQVKLRGYRIELEAVEACLARCPGIREAACRVQGQGAGEILAAHVIPADPGRLPQVRDLTEQLRRSLPGYMVPGVFGALAELPRTAGGKLRRTDLPVLTVGRAAPGAPGGARHEGAGRDGAGRDGAGRDGVVGGDGVPETPRDPVRSAIAEAVRRVLELPTEPGADADFFTDLGGSSLTAAMVVTELRADPATAAITVRDLYQARTVGALTRLAAPPADGSGGVGIDTPAAVPEPPPSPGHPILVTLLQAAWLLLELLVGSALAYVVIFLVLPPVSRLIGLIPLIVLAPLVLPVLGLALSPLSVSLAVTLKKALIGRYTPGRASAWSGLRLRMWMVRQVMRLIPWGTIAGTEFQCMVLRRLGARIGRRVHIHRGVNVAAGGWDLLDIGDDVTISQDASLGLVTLRRGEVVVGPVTLDDGATLDIRAGVGPGTRVGRDGWLTALSSLPAGGTVPDGEAWDGVPAEPVGPAPARPEPDEDGGREWSPPAHGILMIVAGTLLRSGLALPFSVTFALIVYKYDNSYDALLAALAQPAANVAQLVAIGVATIVSLMLMVATEALACRLIGAVRPGVISRWSLAYIRVWLKTGLVTTAGNWLSGGLFWPPWLRAAGMAVGRGCEISTIIDVVPELVGIEADTFFADGIYLGGPQLQSGAVIMSPVSLGRDTFVGNHAVIAAGQRLPDGILLGISTVADDRLARAGTSWFGHPPFELPQREIVTVDRSLTHDPSFARVLTRVFWEWLRFGLPVVPLLATLLWFVAVSAVATALPIWAMLAVAAPVISLATAAGLCLLVLGLKWGLLGRVRAGVHPLWSCWCSRWDFLYVAWGFIAGGVLANLEGTLLLAVYLRRMGMRIGRRVVLDDGFAQVVDPDMLHIEDGATVSAMFQAHTFEDRVLKIAPVRIGAHATLAHATVPLYGADVGEHTVVAPHSVVMKQERLLPHHHYAGAPTRRVDPEPTGPDRTGPEPTGPEATGEIRHGHRHALQFPHWAAPTVVLSRAEVHATRNAADRWPGP